ncbi:60S acidic ribosomal protein P1 [Artemisia annua]|uniref:60S acidic ribosomal protein P1 n=1 Tax=Artemisia annua TaxID=35608 RepID=A0A2U1MFC3_ARTAN|nr:60S acidic ribosomal protein P1 [Artemisia annua]
MGKGNTYDSHDPLRVSGGEGASGPMIDSTLEKCQIKGYTEYSDEGVNAEKIATPVIAANMTIESYWPGLFAKLCEKKSLDHLIMNMGVGGGGVAVAVSALAAEEKKLLDGFFRF